MKYYGNLAKCKRIQCEYLVWSFVCESWYDDFHGPPIFEETGTVSDYCKVWFGDDFGMWGTVRLF